MLLTFKEGALEKIMEANSRRRSSHADLERLAYVYDESGNRVLDIGIHGDVWPGGHSFFFKNAKYETLDIDPYVSPTHVADIRQMPFDDETFDLIICHSVIEHVLEDRDKAYSELYRCLKTGGVIYYVIPIQIEAREVEEAKHVSKTHLLKCHEGLDYSIKELPDRTYAMEVRK